MVEIINGDILEAKEKYIVHQCNSVSNQAGGLAHYLFKKFPHADIYSGRPYPFKVNASNFPGNIIIKGNGKDQRFVINAIAQYYPGRSINDIQLLDGRNIREGYFRMCLTKISKIENLESIAFPIRIGCGLAGGDWKNYKMMIELFAISAKTLHDTKVVIYDNNFP
jgi:O-acetyl-ADP-ribose deacetylase (regulator of RNase III)